MLCDQCNVTFLDANKKAEYKSLLNSSAFFYIISLKLKSKSLQLVFLTYFTFTNVWPYTAPSCKIVL